MKTFMTTIVLLLSAASVEACGWYPGKFISGFRNVTKGGSCGSCSSAPATTTVGAGCSCGATCVCTPGNSCNSPGCPTTECPNGKCPLQPGFVNPPAVTVPKVAPAPMPAPKKIDFKINAVQFDF